MWLTLGNSEKANNYNKRHNTIVYFFVLNPLLSYWLTHSWPGGLPEERYILFRNYPHCAVSLLLLYAGFSLMLGAPEPLMQLGILGIKAFNHTNSSNCS